jgi:hypothetical protein
MGEIYHIWEGYEPKREMYFVGWLYKPEKHVALVFWKMPILHCLHISLESVISERISTDNICYWISFQLRLQQQYQGWVWMHICVYVEGGVYMWFSHFLWAKRTDWIWKDLISDNYIIYGLKAHNLSQALD